MPTIQRLTESHGPEAASQMVRHQLDQLAAFKEVVDKEGIDCDLHMTRSFDIFFDEKHAQQMEEFLSREEARGTPWTKEVQWIEKARSDKVSSF